MSPNGINICGLSINLFDVLKLSDEFFPCPWFAVVLWDWGEQTKSI